MSGAVVVTRLLELAGLIVSLWRFWLSAPRAATVWRIYSGARTRRAEDAGPAPVSPPPDVEAVLVQLRDLGFERLGEQRVTLPRLGVLHDWLMADGANSTVAAVAVSRPGPVLICQTAFAEHAWLQTYYPRGETIDSKKLLARTSAVSVAEAITLHRRGIEEMRPYHGEPRQVQSMTDALLLDAEFREHHLARTLQRTTWAIVRPALLAAALATIFVVLLAAGW